MSTETKPDLNIDRSVGDFSYDVDYEFDAGLGLTERTIDFICDVKKDPDWIREFRKEALRKFEEAIAANGWAPDLAYNVAACHYATKAHGAALRVVGDIIARGVHEHPELSVGSGAGDVRSVGNTPALRETHLVEAFNLKAAIELCERAPRHARPRASPSPRFRPTRCRPPPRRRLRGSPPRRWPRRPRRWRGPPQPSRPRPPQLLPLPRRPRHLRPQRSPRRLCCWPAARG